VVAWLHGRRQASLDLWFATICRYIGLGLMVYAALIDMGRDPALIPAATGLIFFKTIYESAKETIRRNGDDKKNGGDK
jgi:hypothetical protein